ncbi:hypothetical protein [Microbacterium sp. SSM24]|uniref:hypothetical protein n=1 Tax=Microbacterium sp. SSM24 TaxID=2991714 RepID=UPI002225D0B0|nr:hypothetical protein [Microbacterium sp. SSM24]MCW3493746.1 hypothetical protein [Microbacterium sp. SSM24]
MPPSSQSLTVRARRVLRRSAARFAGLPHSEGTVDSPTPETARDVTRLWLRNSRPFGPSVTDPASDVAVSMTTHGPRLSDVWLAIESIGRGTVRPGRLILWLDTDDPLPRRLRRLQRRGLEVRRVEPGVKVHTKYWPYVSTQPLEVPLVTGDDDIVYPETWLEGLLQAHRETPEHFLAYRAHLIQMRDDEILPYQDWLSCDDDLPSYAHFSTSVCGQLFPISLQEALRAEGTLFRELSPNNDDIWYHRTAVLAGIRTRQVLVGQRHWPFVPGSQATGLNATNVWDGGNDRQIAASHTPESRRRIREDLEAQVPPGERA